MSPVVAVSGLTVRALDGTLLLDGVDLHLEPGERVLITGASGSGKSTLLRTLAALEPTPGAEVTGSVLVAGRELVGREGTDDEPLDVGWLPQDPAAAVCLPLVEDDVAFGCENRSRPLPWIEDAVTRALAAVEVLDLRRRGSETLSSGQAQRVGLAAALAPAPALLLLDEPTAMLDPIALRGLRDAVMRPAGHGVHPAILLVEHRLDEWADAGGLPDRVVVLDDGRVLADGPALRVWAAHGAALADAGCHLPWSVARDLREPALPEPALPERALPERAKLGEFAAGRRVRDVHAPNSAVASELGGDDVLLLTEELAVGRGAAVLEDVRLEVRAGEVVAVVGPNGCGKSTLLLTLAGLLPPVTGTIERPGGRPALVFSRPEQQFLAPTVRAELAHDGAPPEAVSAMVRALRLEHAADRSVHRLSGGEQRRLSVGTVLLGDRRVVLADEPTFGLDRHGVSWAVGALRDAAEQGRSVLLTSHDLRFVADVADRVVVLGDGVVAHQGPTAEALRLLAGDAAGLPLPASLRERVGMAP